MFASRNMSVSQSQGVRAIHFELQGSPQVLGFVGSGAAFLARRNCLDFCHGAEQF